MTVKAEDFKKTLQNWASGVTVVTTASSTHGLLGMTATSFASVSMEPPQVLVCINDSALTSTGIAESGYFAVNVLAGDQQTTSNLFAGGASEKDRFASVTWHKGINEVPVLNDSIASLECEVVNQVRAGTHWIIIGKVNRVTCREGEPLLYFRTGYRQLTE
ncbi:MAG: flavin reductase family protein [Methylococcaceae bacterium]|nr:flavin reductase family protein [Methylococcaceae bacterium]